MRRLAVEELRRNIEANENHPSVMLWSIGNELSSQPGPVQVSYINAAVKFAKEMDPTRPVGIAVAAYPSSLCQAAQYKSIDVLGLNDLLRLVPGPERPDLRPHEARPATSTRSAPCYPDKALMVTEFGAEANRDGPVEEKGTWAFQQDWVNYQLGIFATKPWLSGAMYWALNEFWVRPGWEGGNPRPSSPIHQKGLVTYDGVRKPAFADVQRSYTTTPAARSRLSGGDAAARRVRARTASGSARGGGRDRRACRDRTAGGGPTAPRREAGSLPTGRSSACRRRGRCRRLPNRPHRRGTSSTRRRNEGT